ncbi:metallophosphoesterase [Salipiger bermudensis]|uniref:metallophosphoesterase n=1 Tax=Salipiger bermudensis TaxID=344736 RepID=UPI001C99FBA4|nr:metallophosphoesterase [Salipiger bermudensis]MBY6006704.1 metallophosphoesterase [Salipiger bermudensis]
MSLLQAQRAIADKALTDAGKLLGRPAGGVEAAHSGGFNQRFENGVVYWHTNTGPAILRGNIARGYDLRGAEGTDPRTGRRRFGYPDADEALSPDGIPFQRFEFATLVATPGLGSVAVDRDHLLAEEDPTEAGNTLGLPIGDTTGLLKFRFTRFERGVVLSHEAVPQPFVLRLHCGAMLGKPAMVKTDPGTSLPFLFEMRLRRSFVEAMERDFAPGQFAELLKAMSLNHLKLREVGSRQLNALDMSADSREIVGGDIRLRLGPCKLAGPIPDRRLFSLSMTPTDVPGTDNRIYDVVPHAIYSKRSWTHFGMVHATDLHVSRRYDGYPEIWRQRGNLEAVRAFSNPNDNLRNFIRWANNEHAKGRLDLILATGDIVDFIFDNDMDHAGAGNFRFFERLVRGLEPARDRDGAHSEALRVPVFVTFGNHDYRPRAFPMFFRFRVDDANKYINGAALAAIALGALAGGPLGIFLGAVGLLGGIFGTTQSISRDRHEYRGFNLLEEDARDLQGGQRRFLSQDEAEALVAPVDLPSFVFSHLTPQAEYSRSIGDNHLLLMLDSGPDKGVVETMGHWLLGESGLNDDNEAFLAGTPNSRGSRIDPASTQRMIAQTRGLVIVGMHAPPLNTEGNEVPWFFRASARQVAGSDDLRAMTRSFLHRHVPVTKGQDFLASTRPHPLEDDWPTARTDFYAKGRLNELNASGTAQNNKQDWMRVFAGIGAARGVDMVLAGHVHKDVEVSLQTDGDTIRYVNDFHTENRAASYTTIESDFRHPVHVRVRSDGLAEISRQERAEVHEGVVEQFTEVSVPANADTLADAGDKRAWWQRFAPLVIQSPCLGPTDSNHRRPGKQNPVFQGVRQITVEGDVISGVQLVTLETIKQVVSGLALKPTDVAPPIEVAKPVDPVDDDGDGGGVGPQRTAPPQGGAIR